ncbi:hypothetical protein [Microbacterium sp.]|uniref:hypothetical protein n=1 Tax=Microbacterium sp. TaxID=51671 RepID=UPI0028AA13CE|nr:hypothetical protein [Microbacterium sp.]
MTFFEQAPMGSPASRRRRSVVGRISTAAVLVVPAASTVGGLWLMSQDSKADEPLLERIFPALAAPAPPLSAEFADLADRMMLTAEGREVFAFTQPRYADADEIAEFCGDESHDPENESTLGCFTGFEQSRAQDRIFVYRPTDERLAQSTVTTAAHELLHAVYARMSSEEKTQVAELLSAATALVPADDPVHDQIAASMNGDDEKRATEQFAYLGSQVHPDIGFTAELEQIYARTFTDRGALVEMHRRAVAVLEDVRAAVARAWGDVAAAEQANAQTRAQLEADADALSKAAARFADDRAEFEATNSEDRARWRVTLTPVGGEPITMSWEESITYRDEDLNRIRGEHHARRIELELAEAEAARLRADTQALQDDALALLRDAYPGQTFEG